MQTSRSSIFNYHSEPCTWEQGLANGEHWACDAGISNDVRSNGHRPSGSVIRPEFPLWCRDHPPERGGFTKSNMTAIAR
jgi:hypothetical protein